MSFERFRTIGIFAFLLLLPLGSVSSQIHWEERTTAASFLKIPVAPKAIGMGETYCAMMGGINSIHWNPAGLASLEKTELMFTDNEWWDGIRLNCLAIASPLSDGGSLGIGFDLLSISGIEGRDIYENPTGELTAQNYALTISHGRWVNDKSAIGLNLKVIHQELEGTKRDGVAIDLGGLYLPCKDFRLGLSLQNIGPKIKFEEDKSDLPFNLKFGISYLPYRDLSLVFDINQPLRRDLKLSGGFQYQVHKALALRMGYVDKSDFNGLRWGLSFNWKNLQVDYALIPRGDLGLSYLFSFIFGFGRSHRVSTSLTLKRNPNPEEDDTYPNNQNPLWDRFNLSGDGVITSKTDNFISPNSLRPFHASYLLHFNFDINVNHHLSSNLTLIPEATSLCSSYGTSERVTNRFHLHYRNSFRISNMLKPDLDIRLVDLGRVTTANGLILDEFEGEGYAANISFGEVGFNQQHLFSGLTNKEDVVVNQIELLRGYLEISLIYNKYEAKNRGYWIKQGGSLLPESQLIGDFNGNLPLLRYFHLFGEYAKMSEVPKQAGFQDRNIAYLFGGRFDYQDELDQMSLEFSYRKYGRDFNNSLVGNLSYPYFSQEAEDKKFNCWRNYLLEKGDVEGRSCLLKLQHRLFRWFSFVCNLEKVDLIREDSTKKFFFMEPGLSIGLGKNAKGYFILSNKRIDDKRDSYTFVNEETFHGDFRLRFRF